MAYMLKKECLITSFEKSFATLIGEHGGLLGGINQNERSVVFRLAVHLREQFIRLEKKSIYLDSEYNRQGNQGTSKKVYRDLQHDSIYNKYIVPDIVLHNRINDKNNLVYCEIKKDDSYDGPDAEKVEEQVKGKRKYKFGVYIYQLNEHCIELCIYTNECIEHPQKYRFSFVTKKLEEARNE